MRFFPAITTVFFIPPVLGVVDTSPSSEEFGSYFAYSISLLAIVALSAEMIGVLFLMAQLLLFPPTPEEDRRYANRVRRFLGP